jgi:hypothetical protein
MRPKVEKNRVPQLMLDVVGDVAGGPVGQAIPELAMKPIPPPEQSKTPHTVP